MSKKYRRLEKIVHAEEYFPYKHYPDFPVVHSPYPGLIDRNNYQEVTLYKQGYLKDKNGNPITDLFDPGTMMIRDEDGSLSIMDQDSFKNMYESFETVPEDEV